eukprot:6196196-Pleurochrysis_carterae.AAC.1
MPGASSNDLAAVQVHMCPSTDSSPSQQQSVALDNREETGSTRGTKARKTEAKSGYRSKDGHTNPSLSEVSRPADEQSLSLLLSISRFGFVRYKADELETAYQSFVLKSDAAAHVCMQLACLQI